MTPRIGTLDARGADRLLDFLLVARPGPSTAKELRVSVQPVERRRLNDDEPDVRSRPQRQSGTPETGGRRVSIFARISCITETMRAS